jgi:hypothetical protein
MASCFLRTSREQISRIFHGSTSAVRASFRRDCQLGFVSEVESPIKQAISGGRTRERTLDLSRVKGPVWAGAEIP